MTNRFGHSSDMHAPSRLSLFLEDRYDRKNEPGFWLGLSLGLSAITSVAFLIKAFARADGIQDDGRMFLAWMGRWDDPTLLRGDLVADYWSSVSPWFYRGIYHLAWSIGIEPVVFIKILPALLFPPLVYFSFRFLRAIGAEPYVAFVTTAVVLVVFGQVDAVVSGTPRALWPVLLPALLDGLARKRIWQTATAQLLLTGSYPQMALVGAIVIGLSLFAPWHRPWIDFSRRRIAIVLIAAIATIGGMVPFLVDGNRFGPAITLEEARDTPTFNPGGRNTVFEADGSIDFVCGRRVGLFFGACRGPFDPVMVVVALLCFSGPILLFVRMFRSQAAETMRSPVPLYVVLASLAWFLVAASALFQLHLPSRYASGLGPVALLSTLPLILEQIRRLPLTAWSMATRPGRAVMIATTVIALVAFVFGVIRVNGRFVTPANADLMAAISALPKDTVVAGFVDDLDFSPVFTDRPTLFNRELSVAYQTGYYGPIFTRMEAVRDVLLTNDARVLVERLNTLGVDRLLVQQDGQEASTIPWRYRSFFGDDLSAMEEAADRPTLLDRYAKICTTGSFGRVLMLDAACLVREAQAG